MSQDILPAKANEGGITAIRPHIGIAATDIEAAVAFYRGLFGIEPSKLKDGYAKFEVTTPNLNLSINRVEKMAEKDSPFHMGIEVASQQAVSAWRARVTSAGVPVALEEESVTCCFAVQDKFWVEDPDGHRWEIFMVLEDAEVHTANRAPKAEARDCCEPTCCT